MIESALQLARQGIPVFPCHADKSPATRRGFKDATTDANMIRAWWRANPEYLVAVTTGEPSGLSVIDIDPDGFDWLASSGVKSSRIHNTPRGLHLVFSHTKGTRNSAGTIACGVDVRADGGYVIWWPANGYDCAGALESLDTFPDDLATNRKTSRQLATTDTENGCPILVIDACCVL